MPSNPTSNQQMSSAPSQRPIDRPLCPKCQSRMMLARISPAPGGSEQRTFECGKCDHVEKVILPRDPMSTAAGWLAGELHPPK